MNRYFFHICGILLFVSGCGVHTQETVDLSYVISDYTAKQERVIKKAVSLQPLTPKEAEDWVNDAEALTKTSKILAELLGKRSEDAVVEGITND